ncbi:hypothetical protein AWJ20_3504 [Sugiyamaella lignohabitans]|uniref:Uncharacterized protein n=1 Tax=Sugiyamaella lignohabitans TaxID=796027 RepID=A0A161HI19_9ASCO|nr:uncharacterized protein AWJ20_3504 [Sugiyamaella lignohabitans]ANB15860.1 hypothetical protein AWJ20_3504 [Sugiyamaella lignohabitans]
MSVEHQKSYDSDSRTALGSTHGKDETLVHDTDCVQSTLDANGSDGSPVYKVYKRRWFGILVLALLNICASWGWLSFAAISPLVAEYFNLESQAPVNWLSTVILFSYIVISPLVWWVLVKYNIRYALILCSIFIIVGNWVRYAGVKTGNFGATMFGQILIGFAQPFALSSPAYYTDIWFTSSSRVSANAIASLANPLGGAIAQLVGPAIVLQADQLPTFIVITAGVTTACGLLSFIVPIRPELPACPSSTIVKMGANDSIKMLLTSIKFIAVLVMFSIYVGFFNAFSTYTAQIMVPYGYSTNEAGIAGAILIVCGIVFAAVTSPLVDRTHIFIWIIVIQVPLICGGYIAAVFMCTESGQLVGPYLVSAILGATSFSLLPIFLEWTQEQTSPADPAVSSSLLWIGGQLFGAIFIIVMNALKYPDNVGNPPGNMRRSLIFQAVIACVGLLPIIVIFKSRHNTRVTLDTRA